MHVRVLRRKGAPCGAHGGLQLHNRHLGHDPARNPPEHFVGELRLVGGHGVARFDGVQDDCMGVRSLIAYDSDAFTLRLELRSPGSSNTAALQASS